jgi:hypothetical protein
MISTWYMPSWSGDFRLEEEGENQCRLIVSDPTPGEIETLGRFLAKARQRRWIPKVAGIAPKGESTLLIDTSLISAGKVLLSNGKGPFRKKHHKEGILTSVRSKDGKIEAIPAEPKEPEPEPEPLGPPTALAKMEDKEDKPAKPDKVEEALAKPDADKAVTTRRPTLCCPTPVAGPDVRASEVLHAFCTRQQWESWMRNGFLFCNGNLSGHTYRIVHRHLPLAREPGKVTWDMDDDAVIHCYDWSVPPAEEVLAIKLALEHVEHWVRNPSGALGRYGQKDIYPNPFVGPQHQFLDGTQDAGFVSGFGEGLRTTLAIFGGAKKR